MLFPPVFCSYPTPQYWFFSENVPRLVYYSHFLAIGIAVLAAIFVLWAGRKKLPNQLLFLMLAAFSLWVLLDSIFWAANNSDIIMFVWSLAILFEPLVYLCALHLFYTLLKEKPLPFWKSILLIVPYIPIIVAVPINLALPGFDLSTCLSVEGFISIYYVYPLELLYTVILGILAFRKYRSTIELKRKKEILSLAIGTIFFLLAFSWGNIASSFTENWNFAQIGLFAMPIFIAFLTYSIVRFQTFNIKIFGAQALVVAMAILTGSQFFYVQNSTNRILTAVSFSLILFFGWFLIKSVAKESKQKEQLSQYATDMAKTNAELQNAYAKLETLDKAKSEFISIASHQLRTPLTAIKGYVSLMIEGDYGKLSKGALQSMKNVYLANERLVKLVNSLLDMSRIEAGKIALDFSPVKVDDLIADILRELRVEAENKNLKLRMVKDRTTLPKIEADGTKLRDALMNLVDNAIKYTNKGEIAVKIKYNSFEGNVEITVQDTGEGMTGEEIDKLFQSFSRADSGKKNWAEGSGLGLYIAKKFVEMHHGNIRAESTGKGQGSRFIIELPISQPNNRVDTEK